MVASATKENEHAQLAAEIAHQQPRKRTAYPSSAQPANGASHAASNCPGVVDDLIQNRQNKG